MTADPQGGKQIASPSKTFLFDKGCSGRLKYSGGIRNAPDPLWQFPLKSYPSFAPESTPAFDDAGNLYFGAHDGCFYSLTPEGGLRWMFKTGAKIYSSPAIGNQGDVYVGSGDGFLYGFNTKGQLRWVYHVSQTEPPKGKIARKFRNFQTWRKMYDPDRKKVRHCKIWASPKITSDNCILINGLGMGLHAVDAETGRARWCRSFGGIQYHRAGPAIGPENEIYLPGHRRFLHRLTPAGAICWTYDTGLNYDAWGSPSVDPDPLTIYFTLTYRERQGVVISLDPEGNLRWCKRLPAALRGSVTIGYDNWVLVCGFNGVLYYLDKSDGSILHKITLTSARRGLWTTAGIDPGGSVFITTKDSRTSGSIYRIGPDQEIQWRYKTGKALSTPVLDGQARLYAGSWLGELICIQT